MKDQHIIWLGAGIGSIALIVGYMVGASSTPVVGIAVPAVFGLVITAVGFLKSTGIDEKITSLDEKISSLKNTLDHVDVRTAQVSEIISNLRLQYVETTVNDIKGEMSKTPERMGKILVFFTVLYIVGLSFGTYARIVNLFSPRTIRSLPWTDRTDLLKPPTAQDAVDWVGLQEQLLSLGYTHAHINELYSIQSAQWKNEQEMQARKSDNKQNETPETKKVEGNTNSLSDSLSKSTANIKNNGGASTPPSIRVTVEGPKETLPSNQRPPDASPSPTLQRKPSPSPTRRTQLP